MMYSTYSHTSQIKNRCSLFLNHSNNNIEQGLTNADFRRLSKTQIVNSDYGLI